MSELADRTCTDGARRLDDADVASFVAELDGWSIVEGVRLAKQFRFEDFRTALAFVNRIGAIAEAEWHHPDVTLGYGRVGVELTTHDAGGLTLNDFVLAAKIDRGR